jgi:hypothetical protein
MFDSLQDGARALALFALSPYAANAKADWMTKRIVRGVLDDLADLEAEGVIKRVDVVAPTPDTKTPTYESSAPLSLFEDL